MIDGHPYQFRVPRSVFCLICRQRIEDGHRCSKRVEAAVNAERPVYIPKPHYSERLEVGFQTMQMSDESEDRRDLNWEPKK